MKKKAKNDNDFNVNMYEGKTPEEKYEFFIGICGNAVGCLEWSRDKMMKGDVDEALVQMSHARDFIDEVVKDWDMIREMIENQRDK
ncbi:hypothetical protein [Thiofilum flexile]|uniref:hypothetical protein n=1 Tax=Thiofilum flexile TaxID=125627 RepID=UPI00036E9EA7|nr:hypothetical protein [Thiofilum flexile]